MIRKTVLAGIAGLCLVSCASVDARQPSTIEPIAGFSSTGGTSPEGLAGTGPISRQHRGSVTALAATGESATFFSAGEDGFLTRHSGEGNDDSWQVSDIAIRRVSVNPDGNLVAVFETDRFSVNRVSVWDWSRKERVFAKRFKDSVVSLFWSARGTYLMVGNTSLEGLTVLDAKTGNPVSIFKESPGIVTAGVTGKSETSMVTFGPSGRILYTDMASGAERASYAGPTDVESPAMLDNNLKISGMQSGSVVFVDATSGKLISSWPSAAPVMATSNADTLPVWFESAPDSAWVLRTGDASSQPFTLGDGDRITAALSNGQEAVFGTDAGKLYRVSLQVAARPAEAVSPAQIPNREIRAIDDIVSDGERVYLLSGGSLFVTTEPGTPPTFACSGIEGNRLAFDGDSLLFWSATAAGPLVLSSRDGSMRKTLYQSTEGIRSLSVSGSFVSFVEGTSKVTVLDLVRNASVFSYSGAGLQDAVLSSSRVLLVSRSSTRRAPNPVITINVDTGETVPLQIEGDLCYGLKAISSGGADMAAFLVKADDPTRTELVSFSLDASSPKPVGFRTLASYADEDLVATLFVSADRAYTNLGKSSLAGVSLAKAGAVAFKRGYSLPLKATVTARYVISLNQDGTLTWFDGESAELISCSAITADGYWLEQ